MERNSLNFIDQEEKESEDFIVNEKVEYINDLKPETNLVAKNKWVALTLCFFLGWLGAHKFYEDKVGLGILYIFTGGIFGIGLFIDFIVLLFKPTIYYVDNKKKM